MYYCAKLVFIFMVVWPLKFFAPKLNPFFKKAKKSLFFDDFFAIIYEGYFIFIICCLFNLLAPTENHDNNLTNKILGYSLLFITIIFVPSILVYLLLVPRQKLEE